MWRQEEREESRALEKGEASQEETKVLSGALGKLTCQDMLAREGYTNVF